MIPNTQPPCTTTASKLWVIQHCHLLKKKKKKKKTCVGIRSQFEEAVLYLSAIS